MQENVRAWEMWKILSRFDRQIGFDGYIKLSLSQMKQYCEDEDGLDTDLTKMMFLEEKLFPVIRSRTEKESK